MTSVVGLWHRLCGDGPVPEVAPVAASGSVRSARQMIAGCEYELRQLRRDMTPTLPDTAGEAMSGEPFILGAKQRNATYRARLAAEVDTRDENSETRVQAPVSGSDPVHNF